MTTTGFAVRRDGRDVLLHDDLGVLTLRRLRPWHRVAARCAAARLDRELAAGASPEVSARLGARAGQLTSAKYRRDLAASLLRLLAAAGEPGAAEPGAGAAEPGAGVGKPGAVVLVPGRAGRPARLPLCRARIRQSGPVLAELAGRLAEPGPVPVRGVAIVSQLLADGTGPLYHAACADDLEGSIGRALTLLL
jgi:hypothetical protein